MASWLDPAFSCDSLPILVDSLAVWKGYRGDWCSLFSFCVILVDGEEEQEEEEEEKEDLEGRGCAVPFLSCNGRVCVSAFLCASNFLSLHFANTRPHSSLLPSCFFNSSFFSCFGIVQLVSAKKKKKSTQTNLNRWRCLLPYLMQKQKKKRIWFFFSFNNSERIAMECLWIANSDETFNRTCLTNQIQPWIRCLFPMRDNAQIHFIKSFRKK